MQKIRSFILNVIAYFGSLVSLVTDERPITYILCLIIGPFATSSYYLSNTGVQAHIDKPSDSFFIPIASTLVTVFFTASMIGYSPFIAKLGELAKPSAFLVIGGAIGWIAINVMGTFSSLSFSQALVVAAIATPGFILGVAIGIYHDRGLMLEREEALPEPAATTTRIPGI